MTAPSLPEVWLRGAVPGVAPMLQPVAHALLQAREDLERTLPPLTDSELWARPGGAASVGYHVRHLLGSLDRLLTYAEGRTLSEAQLAALREEASSDGPDASSLLATARDRIDAAVERVRAAGATDLLAARAVGRAKLPSTVLGLMFHAAEHTTRHVGQVITTAKVVRGGMGD